LIDNTTFNGSNAHMNKWFSYHLIEALYAALLGFPVGLLISAFMLSIYNFIQESSNMSEMAGILPFALLAALAALIIGIIPCALFGVPAYSLLTLKGKANYLTSLLVGIFPGTLISIFIDHYFGLCFILFGGVIALSTHFFATKLFKKTDPI
jgi:hypothetical protein